MEKSILKSEIRQILADQPDVLKGVFFECPRCFKTLRNLNCNLCDGGHISAVGLLSSLAADLKVDILAAEDSVQIQIRNRIQKPGLPKDYCLDYGMKSIISKEAMATKDTWCANRIGYILSRFLNVVRLLP